jgi:phytoene synthase
LPVSLEDSYRFCRRIARTRARNFYYSFLLLSPEQKDAMCAVYAFMRFCDDISEGEGATAAAIEQWRAELSAALAGRYSGHPVWPAFHDSVERYKIPHRYFQEMIDGVSGDLMPRRMQTFEELYRYCYQVASVVGLTIVHIFGFDSPDALVLAEKCGIAFQLTNVLRDVREDTGHHRIYIPAEDLERFQADLEKHDENFVELMRFEARRARAYYNESRPLIQMVEKRSRSSLWALIEIYSRLLDRIERSNFDVLEKRISLPVWQKLAIVAQAGIR